MSDESMCTSVIQDSDISNMYLIKSSLKKEINTIELTDETLEYEYHEKASLLFRLILGNFIKCLEEGNKTIIYKYKNKYYYKLHKMILENMGYDFNIYELNYKNLKKINPKLKLISYLYNLFLSKLMNIFIHKQDKYIRNNIGFEINKGSFERIKKSAINKYINNKGIIDLIKKYIYYNKRYKSIFIDKPKNSIKVAVIGNLFSTYFIEKYLASKNIEVNVINKNSNILRYKGIIYIRDYYNTSEMKFLEELKHYCSNEKIPLMYLNIDEKSNEENIKSKLDVFNDMIKIKAY